MKANTTSKLRLILLLTFGTAFVSYILSYAIISYHCHFKLLKDEYRGFETDHFDHNFATTDWLHSQRFSNINEDLMTHEKSFQYILNYMYDDDLAMSSVKNSEAEVKANGGGAVNEILKLQSLCVDKSPFLNTEQHNLKSQTQKTENIDNDKDEDRRIKYLAMQLIYLVIHDHQHAPAQKEALERREESLNNKNQNNKEKKEKQKIGKLDYQCSPDTKYLVASIPIMGMGALFRLSVVYTLMIGISSNRVVIFVNNLSDSYRSSSSLFYNTTALPSAENLVMRDTSSKSKHERLVWKTLVRKWNLASCKRGDHQCVFMPITPCVLTYGDIIRAPILTPNQRTELRDFGRVISMKDKQDDQEQPENNKSRKSKSFVGDLNKERVLIISSEAGIYEKWPHQIREVIKNKIEHLIKKLQSFSSTSFPANVSSQDLQKVFVYIDNMNDKKAKWVVNYAALFYSLRPNLEYQEKINTAIDKIFPRTNNNSTEVDQSSSSSSSSFTMIGLAVRSSDKCLHESECLSFEQYMSLLKDRTMEYRKIEEETNTTANDKYRNIVLTSESLPILDSRKQYEPYDPSNFPYDFIVNTQEIGQGTGNPMEFDMEADDIMLSSLISLKMQLYPELVILNFCSNFHRMINEFRQMGCAADFSLSSDAIDEYLMKDHPNPTYRICCGWDHECKAKKLRDMISDGTTVQQSFAPKKPKVKKSYGKEEKPATWGWSLLD